METLDLKSNGIVFHGLGAATAKAFFPYVCSLAFGDTRVAKMMILTYTKMFGSLVSL